MKHIPQPWHVAGPFDQPVTTYISYIALFVDLIAVAVLIGVMLWQITGGKLPNFENLWSRMKRRVSTLGRGAGMALAVLIGCAGAWLVLTILLS
jgi:hypothetical protein